MSFRLPNSLTIIITGMIVVLTACVSYRSNTPVAPPTLPISTKTASVIVQPTIAPSDTPAPTASPMGILFSDDFTNPESGWDVRNDADAITDYQNGEFVIFVGKKGTTLWSNPNHYLTDVDIEVDTREAAGPDDNLYGIICRYQDANNFYRLVIAGNGYAGITKRAKGVVTVLSGDFLKRSPTVKRGQASNHLRANCKGSQLSLYVNGKLVAKAKDRAFKGGDAGLLASTGKHPGVEIHFANFIIKQP